MACASCGGGRRLTPNNPQQTKPISQQSTQQIFVSSSQSGGPGAKQQLTPNQPATTRTQI
jgi:hypothetical protein